MEDSIVKEEEPQEKVVDEQKIPIPVVTDFEENFATQTQIQNRYAFWYHRRGGKSQSQSINYEESMKQLATFQTIEHFWNIYNHMIRPSDIKSTTDYHLFKDGIKPTWEDPQNSQGGKWMVRLKKGLASLMWEEIVLSVIGEQFDVGHEVCGAVVSVRNGEDIISVWNKTADNVEATNKIREHMRRVMRLPLYVQIEYKKHIDSLADKSSFRNPTVVWKPKENVYNKEGGSGHHYNKEGGGGGHHYNKEGSTGGQYNKDGGSGHHHYNKEGGGGHYTPGQYNKEGGGHHYNKEGTQKDENPPGVGVNKGWGKPNPSTISGGGASATDSGKGSTNNWSSRDKINVPSSGGTMDYGWLNRNSKKSSDDHTSATATGTTAPSSEWKPKTTTDTRENKKADSESVWSRRTTASAAATPTAGASTEKQ